MENQELQAALTRSKLFLTGQCFLVIFPRRPMKATGTWVVICTRQLVDTQINHDIICQLQGK